GAAREAADISRLRTRGRHPVVAGDGGAHGARGAHRRHGDQTGAHGAAARPRERGYRRGRVPRSRSGTHVEAARRPLLARAVRYGHRRRSGARAARRGRPLTASILYAYGVVRPAAPIARAPRGLDDTVVALEQNPGRQVAALVSRVDPAIYTSDVAGSRAGAHDAVLSWASEAGGVVPFPMFTLFASPDSLRAMLRERDASLGGLLDRVAPCQEWTVRVFRLDDRAAAALAETSPAIADLEHRAKAAAPGQRYLLERKADELRGAELRRVSGDTAREAFDALAALGERAVR